MVNRWKLCVLDFGKIKKADIEVSPFMVFVGKNNSGKSYLMVLLWGILNEAWDLVNEHLKNHPSVPALHAEVLKQLKEYKSTRVEITVEQQQLLLGAFNEILNQNKSHLIKKLFRHHYASSARWPFLCSSFGKAFA